MIVNPSFLSLSPEVVAAAAVRARARLFVPARLHLLSAGPEVDLLVVLKVRVPDLDLVLVKVDVHELLAPPQLSVVEPVHVLVEVDAEVHLDGLQRLVHPATLHGLLQQAEELLDPDRGQRRQVTLVPGSQIFGSS